MKNWSFLTNISFYFENGTRYGHITIEDEEELVCDLSNGVISNDLQSLHLDFKITIL